MNLKFDHINFIHKPMITPIPILSLQIPPARMKFGKFQIRYNFIFFFHFIIWAELSWRNAHTICGMDQHKEWHGMPKAQHAERDISHKYIYIYRIDRVQDIHKALYIATLYLYKIDSASYVKHKASMKRYPPTHYSTASSGTVHRVHRMWEGAISGV